ncbi:Di-copper centre-containing protein [Aspergillus sclerotiicarbonarius CBS 121057]|uniref:Di-copper centre-containing protein n=1 Tax=Aspergillus sclerotiicarbonarius (strain CBS 121057 / IBT 28362) TaxID=1448318 RepID=A0A319FPE3_ASPSB|nr:Di-copper centre-containing protein [Aspergillus sclerotiicarbonarius CBS 121057]
MSDAEKHEYIEAELCLMRHPPVTGLVENATNVWDEFANIHITQGNDIHYVGQFLPWHRYYVRTHELALQKLCNYTGAHPYWDELTDLSHGNIASSPIFDPNTGFGGNGTGNNSCVADGPFKDIVLHISNHHQRGNEFCLSRDLSQSDFSTEAASNVETCFGYANYTDAWQCYNGNPHGGGHGGVGGLMRDPIDSCNDPLFFMHHAYLDKLWWEWQMVDLPHRLYDMGGNNTAPQYILDEAGLSQPGADILNYDGDPGTTTTLNHTLSVICAEYVVDERARVYNTSVHTYGQYTSEF